MSKNSKRTKRQLRCAKKRNSLRSEVADPLDLATLQHWRVKRSVRHFDDGSDLEDIIQEICKRIGVPDLIFRSTKFKDGRNEKEVADVLVLFDKKLIAFQIKHKNIDPHKSVETILGRATKLVDTAFGQFETVIKLLNNGSLPKAKNLRGNELDLGSFPDLELICIAIVAFPGVDNFPKKKKFELQNGFRTLRNFPVHIFDINDFDKISLELDTIPDLLDYLQERRRMLEGAMIGDLYELDFLAFYKTKLHELSEEHGSKNLKIILESGLWEHYVNKLGPAILKRNKLNEVSYIVDHILHGSHRAIGYDSGVNPCVRLSAPERSAENHFALATALAGIKRLDRRSIGEALRDCCIRADNNFATKKLPYAFRICKCIDDPHQAVVILCVVESLTKQERYTLLYNLCLATYCRFDLKAIVGIATESAKSSQRSEDFIVAGDLEFSDEERAEFDSFATKCFGPQRIQNFSEYGGAN